MGNRTHRVIEGGYSASDLWESSGRETSHPLTPTLQSYLDGAHVVYAMRLEDGIIKIGCTKNLANRSFQLHGQIIAFRLGDFDDEKTIHEDLKPHRARGHEYYHPTPEVFAYVNDMRDDFGMPHIAA